MRPIRTQLLTLSQTDKHITKTIASKILINEKAQTIWENITNVKIEKFSDPFIFKLLGIPKPLRAEIISEGQDVKRIAYFDTGKKFIQKILVWKPLTEYSFSFNPEKGFIVCNLSELSEGVFRIPTGTYFLTQQGHSTTLQFSTTYSIDKRFYYFV